MEVSAVRSAVLADRNSSSIESSGSKEPLWSPARMIERSQEGIRGDLGGFNLLAPPRNLMMSLCFSRDRPSTASWWTVIAGTFTFKVEGDSLRSNLSCRKESTTPIMHIRGSSRQEEHQFANRDSTSVHRLALLKEPLPEWWSLTACGGPLKSATSHPGATHEGSTDLDAGAIWCRSPWERRSFHAPRRVCCEENEFGKPCPGRSLWRDQQDLLLVLPDLAVYASRLIGANAYLRKASCVPVCQCLHNTNTAGSGRTRGKQTGLPELSRIDSRSAESSRDGVATLWGTWAVMRKHRLQDWAPPECGQHAAIWAVYDSRGGDGDELWHAAWL